MRSTRGWRRRPTLGHTFKTSKTKTGESSMPTESALSPVSNRAWSEHFSQIKVPTTTWRANKSVSMTSSKTTTSISWGRGRRNSKRLKRIRCVLNPFSIRWVPWTFKIWRVTTSSASKISNCMLNRRKISRNSSSRKRLSFCKDSKRLIKPKGNLQTPSTKFAKIVQLSRRLRKSRTLRLERQ